ncbi:hypothetical protein PTKIN_Ptkin05aG0170600 [Pterospermum kingtungense]
MCQLSQRILLVATKLKDEFAVACLNKNPIQSVSHTGWSPPLEDFLKINVDATFSSCNRESSVAAIVRDHQGAMVCCATQLFHRVESVLQAELYVIKVGLELALLKDLRRVVLELILCCLLRKFVRVSIRYVSGAVL